MVGNIPLVSTCGLLVRSLQRCAHVDRSSPVIPRLTRFSRFSGAFPEPFVNSYNKGYWANTRSFLYRLLGTPDENIWPGISSFPDYKPTFPKWKRQDMANVVPGLEDAGLDLIEGLLEYDPVRRLSAKQACLHPYFQHGSSYYSGRNRTKGYH